MSGELHQLDPAGTLGVHVPSLAPTGPEAEKRTKNPVYDVLKRSTDRTFTLVATNVSAPTREAAIEKTTKDGGEFMVVASKDVRIIKREVRTEIVSEFS